MNDRTMLMTESILLSHLPNALVKRGTVTAGSDLNDYTQTGSYMMDIKSGETVENLPPERPKNGLLIVLNHFCLVQIIIPGYSGGSILYRIRWYSLDFHGWREIATSEIVTST